MQGFLLLPLSQIQPCFSILNIQSLLTEVYILLLIDPLIIILIISKEMLILDKIIDLHK